MRAMNVNPRGPMAQPTTQYELMLFCYSFRIRRVLQVIEMSSSNDSEHSSIHYYVGIARGTLEALVSTSGSDYCQVMQLTSRQSIGTSYSRKYSSTLIRMDQIA